jgi:D-alanine transaminase
LIDYLNCEVIVIQAKNLHSIVPLERPIGNIAPMPLRRLFCSKRQSDVIHARPQRESVTMQVVACLNGEIMPAEEARVSVWDRGFLFGDSVYEVFRLYQGRCWLEAQHLERLKRSLKELEFAPHDLTRLMDRAYRTIEASSIQEGTLYVQVTRGPAPRSHPFPRPAVPPTEVIIVRPYDDAPTALVRETGVPMISHADLRWRRCDIKSTNLLANVLAIESAHRVGAYEAVLIDAHGFVTEATHSSLLWVRQGRLEGTPEGHEILPGTTRQIVLRLIDSLEIPFAGTQVTLRELKAADELILVATTTEVMPVIELDRVPIGTGRPGPIAERLHRAYKAAVRDWLAEAALNRPLAAQGLGG